MDYRKCSFLGTSSYYAIDEQDYNPQQTGELQQGKKRELNLGLGAELGELGGDL